MTIVWRNRNPPTTQADLDRFERERGLRLPDAYKAFIMREQGGEAIGGDTDIAVPGWGTTGVYHWFGATPKDLSFFNAWLGDFSGPVSRSFVQFALGLAGQVFVIDLRPKTHGKVYVRDHHGPPNIPHVIDGTGFDPNDHEEAQLYHPVADSFEAFLAMLGPDG